MNVSHMPGHLIRRLHQRSGAEFQRHVAAAGFDLTSVQYAALDALTGHPGIDQAQLAALIAYDRATIGGVVDRLEGKGLIARRISDTDRRARVLTLTPEGEATFAAMRPVVRALQADILASLDAQEVETFLTLARKALGLNPAP